MYALLALMLVLWSANFIFAKLAVRELPLLRVIGLRYVFAGMFIWPVYVLAIKRRDPAVHMWGPRDIPVLAGSGLLGLVGNQVLFVIGLSLTSVAHAAVITALAPVLVLLGAAANGQERVTPLKAGGMLAAASGIVILQFGKASAGGHTLTGDAVMLASCLVFSLFSIFGKRTAAQFGSLTLNAFAYVSAGLLALPFLIGVTPRQSAWNAGVAAWSGILYMSVFTSIVGYLIYAYALRHMPASRVASVTYVQPVLASLLAVPVLHERPDFTIFVAGALVLSGVYLAGR